MIEWKKSHRRDQKPSAASPAIPAGVAQPPDVASNLRHIRREQGLSLETLARMSGVSRAMLGQIESGRSVPTITLIWKIAQALRISATELIASQPDIRSVLIPKSRQRTILSGNGGLRFRPFAKPDFPLPFSVSELMLQAGHREEFPGAALGAQAVLIVIRGSLEIAFAPCGEPSCLEDGDAILFNSNFEHWLFNPGPGDAAAHLIAAVPRSTDLR